MAPTMHAEAACDGVFHAVGVDNSMRLHPKLGNLPINTFKRQSEIKQFIKLSVKNVTSTCAQLELRNW